MDKSNEFSMSWRTERRPVRVTRWTDEWKRAGERRRQPGGRVSPVIESWGWGGAGGTCVRANGWDTGLTRIWRSFPFRSELSILSKWASTQKILRDTSQSRKQNLNCKYTVHTFFQNILWGWNAKYTQENKNKLNGKLEGLGHIVTQVLNSVLELSLIRLTQSWRYNLTIWVQSLNIYKAQNKPHR